MIDFSVDDGQVTLSWTTPSDTGDSPISHYEYQYRENGTEIWSDWISEDSNGVLITDTNVDVTGLTNGTDYEFQVRAVNDSGQQSPESSSVTATPLLPPPPIVLRPPTAPTDLNTSRGDGQVTLSWTAPTNSGSTPIKRYEYRYATGVYPNHSSFTDWTSTGSTNTTYIVVGLTNDTQHLFQVRAVNYNEFESGASNTAFATPRPPAPIWSNIPDPYNLTVGESLSLDLNSYVTGSPTITKAWGTIPAGLSLSNGVLSGTVTTVEDRSIQFTATNTGGYALSEWVNIVVTADTPIIIVTAPVWSNIPDPYNLTVGDSFSLDLNSYVTGSPTITKTLGAIPAGLSLSGGVLSGTVTTVEDRSIQFTATNTGGYALSEWVNIVVTADTPVIIVTAPVWSDIPDPIYRAIGESLSLDLNSYVTGSPTITRTLGRIPAGLSLSNGELSGTPTTVEDRGLQFTATNTAGNAKSEWVNIVIRPLRIRNIPESDLTMTRNQFFSLDLSQYVVSNRITTLSVTGILPIGISLNNGTLSGTPTGTNTVFLISINGTNSHGSHSRLYIVNVND